jgi:hypothetical protein
MYKKASNTLFVNTDPGKNYVLKFGWDNGWSGCEGSISYIDPNCFPKRRWAFISELAIPINGNVNIWGKKGDSSGYISCGNVIP